MAFFTGIFTFWLRPTSTQGLPEYLGSALRGGFGRAFRRSVCVLRRSTCDACPLAAQCPYLHVFETPAPSGVKFLAQDARAPHPFVITPPGPGVTVERDVPVRVVLAGRALDYLPHFVWAFRKLGEEGLGGARVPFSLERITQEEETGAPATLYDAGGSLLASNPRLERLLVDGNGETAHAVELHFLTPLRLRHRRRLVVRLSFDMLITNILRRLTLLDQCHGDGGWRVDHKALIEQSRTVRIAGANLRWFDWTRYSSRQRTKMQMGGLLGRIRFEGELTPFMPLLRAAEVVNVGRNTSFGLGRMVVRKV